MTAGKIYRFIFIGISAFVLIVLHVLSTAEFRLRAARFYRDRGQYAKSMRVYNRILRKNLVKPGLPAGTFAQVSREFGYVAARLGLRNLAIEVHARGSAKFSLEGLHEYYDRAGLDIGKLPAIGLLEAGRFGPAVIEFRRLSGLYPDFQDAGRYIDVAADLQKRDIVVGSDKFYFNLGDSYIENGLFNEARSFFTKRILDYGVSLLDALRYLNKRYSRDTGVISKVWGDDIYVVLEDFEMIDTQLKRYLSSTAAKVNRHYIINESARGAGHSEFLDITYSKEGYDYWSKDVNIPLNAPDLNFGVRLFIKSDNPSKQTPFFWIAYGDRPELTGICRAPHVRRDLGNGWEEWRVNDLVESAGALGLKRNWSLSNMLVEKVIIDMQSGSGKFYLDGVELFLKR